MLNTKLKQLFATAMFLIMTMFIGEQASAATGSTGGSDNFFQHYVVGPFSELIKGIAGFFHGNYGLSIIFVTIIVRVLVFPLFANQYKKQRAMQEKMALVKPELDAIQSKLKKTKDPVKQREIQQEMMQLYQKHNINPLAMGCLPMLIQFPILIGFYYAIRSTPEIASHSFLWFNLGHSDIIVSLCAGFMYFIQFYVSQKLNAQNAQSNPAAQQSAKIMGFFFPVMMTIFSINVPAALPLYWLTSGLLLTIQSVVLHQVYQKNKKAIQPAESATK
ncbi:MULTISPECIES: membrane protein insertase YidC [Bacillus]|nr:MULTISPECIES: membrane protein insertase YidC [Bacillus]MCJ2147821.1 membrane protein insertase YidC [Bacillus sp. B19-2]MDN5385941.1 membrane protein insertase YidC [Bacillus sp. LB7]MEC1022044.1 membrane protein insertase YidC [Bacillus paralicheniformis]MEC1026095.1 membrane protein insertase YidC [Bacillus paralicheniformis]MEC1035227.1 membrane protein insertase YidC [Bacillus paralicheniformis]